MDTADLMLPDQLKVREVSWQMLVRTSQFSVTLLHSLHLSQWLSWDLWEEAATAGEDFCDFNFNNIVIEVETGWNSYRPVKPRDHLGVRRIEKRHKLASKCCNSFYFTPPSLEKRRWIKTSFDFGLFFCQHFGFLIFSKWIPNQCRETMFSCQFSHISSSLKSDSLEKKRLQQRCRNKDLQRVIAAVFHLSV